MATSWPDLPPELVAAISKSLTKISDYLRFRSVCTSWRSATCSSPNHLPPQSPWLGFPSTESADHLDFFNFFTHPNYSKIQTLPLPRDEPKLLGSSDGFLVILTRYHDAIFLYNPVTHSYFNLPFPRIFRMSPFIVKKIVISPPPIFTAIAISSLYLALSHPGGGGDDDSWSIIQGECSPFRYHDALFFNGRFHVVDMHQTIFAVDGNLLTEIVGVRISRRGGKNYLVEFGGELLLVVRHFDGDVMEGERDDVVTRGFTVFRARDSGEVKSLGNGVMFLGLNRSIVMLGEEYSGFRGDCIYFLDDGSNSSEESALSGGGDAGVFDMSDGSIQPLPYHIGDYGRHPVVWFTPSLMYVKVKFTSEVEGKNVLACESSRHIRVPWMFVEQNRALQWE